MKIINHKIVITLVLVTISLAIAINTEASFKSGSFVVDAFYNHGQIYCSDDDCEITASTQAFTPPSSQKYPLYTAELYDSSGKLLISSTVDQKNGFGLISENPGHPISQEEQKNIVATDTGLIRLIIPFDTNASKIVIKNNKGVVVSNDADFTLWPGVFCNNNNVCEPQISENQHTCPSDCQLSPTYIPVNNTSPSPSTTPLSPRSKAKIILPLIIWFGLAIGLGAVWFIMRRRRPTY